MQPQHNLKPLMGHTCAGEAETRCEPSLSSYLADSSLFPVASASARACTCVFTPALSPTPHTLHTRILFKNMKISHCRYVQLSCTTTIIVHSFYRLYCSTAEEVECPFGLTYTCFFISFKKNPTEVGIHVAIEYDLATSLSNLQIQQHQF